MASLHARILAAGISHPHGRMKNMPLYEYECQQCKRRFELMQKFSDPPAETCRSCGSPVTRLISAPAFQFKGTGWYVTDYARKSSGKEASTSGDGDVKKGKENKDDKSKKSEAADSKTTPKSEGKTKDSSGSPPN